jgi:mono/diheme cytochrome c family protein
MKTFAILIIIGLLFTGCKKGDTDTLSQSGVSKLSQKELMYYSNGKKIYTTLCTNCHTEEGAGLGRLIPPLKNSDYLMADLGRTAQIIKFGQRGPIMVNGIAFNQPMPANPKLTNLEIAELITYISNSWGNSAKGFTIEEVQEGLKEKTIN